MLAAINLKRAREKQPTVRTKDLPKFKVADLVLLKDHKTQNRDAKYMPKFCICKVINDRAYDLKDLTGHVRCAAVTDVQLLMPAEYIVSMLPEIKVFGWACNYINDPFLMPDLKCQNSNLENAQTLDQNANTTKHKYDL